MAPSTRAVCLAAIALFGVAVVAKSAAAAYEKPVGELSVLEIEEQLQVGVSSLFCLMSFDMLRASTSISIRCFRLTCAAMPSCPST